MTQFSLYSGVWPQNVSKLAKYAVRSVDGQWRVTVLYAAEQGLQYLLVDSSDDRLPERVNAIKTALGTGSGGPFYVNEYKHVLVPVASTLPDVQAEYYYAGHIEGDLTFEFEGHSFTTKPILENGDPLQPGDRWVGPRPGIPYVLAAGAEDVYFRTPALTSDDPPKVRPGATRKVDLSKILGDVDLVRRATAPIAHIRGHQGGRFYVNEHGAMFTPVGTGDGNGIDYVYCGQIDRSAWFPEPNVGEQA